MTKLNDIQLILLTNSSTRGNGSLLPVAASIADAGERLGKALAYLAKRGLAEELPATDAASTWRTDGDDRFGMFITDAGRAAINVDADNAPESAATDKPAKTSEPKPERQTKSAAVVALLQRKKAPRSPRWSRRRAGCLTRPERPSRGSRKRAM